jgi:hypothetical protein
MMIQQLQQRVQQAEGIMSQMQQELAGKQAENQTKVHIAQLQMNQALELRRMQDATAISVAKIAALARGVISDNERQVEEIALAAEQDRTAAQMAHDAHTQARDHAHEHVQGQIDRAHEAQLQAMTQAHQSATGAIQLEADQTEAEAARAHEVEMQPEPETETEQP